MGQPVIRFLGFPWSSGREARELPFWWAKWCSLEAWKCWVAIFFSNISMGISVPFERLEYDIYNLQFWGTFFLGGRVSLVQFSRKLCDFGLALRQPKKGRKLMGVGGTFTALYCIWNTTDVAILYIIYKNRKIILLGTLVHFSDCFSCNWCKNSAAHSPPWRNSPIHGPGDSDYWQFWLGRAPGRLRQGDWHATGCKGSIPTLMGPHQIATRYY